ncbi:chemotaxis protein CheA [uncultured Paludibaculum sp.]|uniref:chemotaxis protein CheA n=1 Tax=uncultured Paludibaculum sp. TaxID=1765020 RepID=UPI002AAB584F|nr:chemotaxis protein CheA [uncultured Paludibaculum sp.]
MAYRKRMAPRRPVAAAPTGNGKVTADLQALATSVAIPKVQNSQEKDMAQALNQDPQLVEDFLVEAREHLANIEARLLEIEQGAHTPETLHSAFRSFHTLKGLAGFLEYAVIQEVAHEVENLLDLARNDALQLTPPIVDVILQSGDFLAGCLRGIEAGNQGRTAPPMETPTALLEQVRAMAAAPQSPGVEVAVAPEAGAQPESAPALSPEVHRDAAAMPDQSPAEAATGPKRNEASLVKVETGKLEYLVEMVGELMIAESMLHHNQELAEARSPRVQRDLSQLARVTAEVQKTAMAMRMVPIGILFRRMTRLVRDLARKSGKLAELELHGEDVELDRTIVEELSDPLVHMLRNALDHGLESPDEREAVGKPASGKVRLKAAHQAGQIVIELSDDGRGLDRGRILAKAVQRGLVSPEANLSDNEVYHLIFEPGFSTAERVTDVSGRGVGMDVVRKHISKLRGRIDISSTVGRGTTFALKVPLTLAIIDGLVTVVGGVRYIVPIFAVREMFRPTPDRLFTVEGRGEMVLVRERLLPVVRLSRRLGVKARTDDPCEGVMIVGESEDRQYCLLVDELAGKQEVVIKNLGATFRGVRGVAGGAILGDGRVGLILDLATLFGEIEHAA